ncbi:ROK family protein [Nonomuraea sp. NEAU-A123]|uniref:ROK family protein n=1 Tax=Nonomuraea sp. NEAU-A123 TaxID=2839649 RepID=UPI001BE4941A|nr:ROK family protein [Nonomuraea sp. NEAU-A123]MBT2235728.1 ROK family protein [Nonomuraea sp. NEAU-A123]
MSRVLGIDVGGTKVAVGVSSSDGPEIAERIRLDTGAGTLERALAAARDLDGAPAAVGFSTCGVIRDGRIWLAPNVPGWEGLELPRLLREEYGAIPVAIDNDVKAAAAAELRWGALRSVSTGVYLNLGTGLAAALVVNGQVVSGAHGAAGEIGYLQAIPGEPAFADGHVPLEERVSGAALAARGTALLGRETTAAELFALFAAADTSDGALAGPDVAGLVDEALGLLAMSVANLCATFDPECLVVGGGMMGAADLIMPRLTAELRRTVPFPPEVRPARFTDDAPLLGALALAHAASQSS